MIVLISFRMMLLGDGWIEKGSNCGLTFYYYYFYGRYDVRDCTRQESPRSKDA